MAYRVAILQSNLNSIAKGMADKLLSDPHNNGQDHRAPVRFLFEKAT